VIIYDITNNMLRENLDTGNIRIHKSQ
jgi:hypothetical protein